MALGLVRQLVNGRSLASYLFHCSKLQKIAVTSQARNYKFYSIFTQRWDSLKYNSICAAKVLPIRNDSRGFKDKDVLTKRCKDCYFQRVDGRWYVFCQTHPRHKQRQKVDEKSKWIITHSTHGVKKF